MISTFLMTTGHRIKVTAIHAAGVVCIEKTFPGSDAKSVGIHIPINLAGVVAQAIEAAGQAIENGPCRWNPFARSATSCTGDCRQGRDCTCKAAWVKA